MKLGALKIGELNVLTCGTFTNEQSGDNESFVVADTLSSLYEDISSIENWHNIGAPLVGKFYGFKDWKCIRNEIKNIVYDTFEVVGNITDGDWYNWENQFTQNEREIISVYLLNKIPLSKLIGLYGNNPTKFNELAKEFDENSTLARRARLQAGRIFVFNHLTISDAMKVVNEVNLFNLYVGYLQGIESLATDGYEGIMDYAANTVGTTYETNGIWKNFTTTKTGITKQQFSDSLVGILSNGLY